VKVETTILVSFGIAAFAGALAGAIITPLTSPPTIRARCSASRASAPRCSGCWQPARRRVGGIALGLLEAFGSFYISSDFKDAIAFAVLLLILFVRPSGLLGRADIVKV